jgi:hypothetical protein
MPDDLYDRDILIWAEHQASLLRRLAHGEPVREAVDWPHLIEEVEDLGRAELHACESLLRQAMLHLLKLHLDEDQPALHWRAETIGFLADAAARFTPAMAQRIDLDRLFTRARHQAIAAASKLPADLPRACSWSLASLVGETTEIDQLLAALQPEQA